MKNNKKVNALNAQSTSGKSNVTTNEVKEVINEANEVKDAQTSQDSQANEVPTNEANEAKKRELREKIANTDTQLETLSKFDFTGKDAKEIIKLGKDIETLQKQKMQLEKQLKALDKEASNSLKEAQKKAKEALEAQAIEKRELCESLAKKELELTIFQRMLSALDQSAIWTFNAWTESDFLLTREKHQDIIQNLETNSKLIDAFELQVKSYVETLSDEIRKLHIDNAEILHSDIMKQSRRKINGLSQDAMKVIVDQTSNQPNNQESEQIKEIELSKEKREKLNANSAKFAKV